MASFLSFFHLQKLKPIEDIRKKRKRYRANKKRIFSSWKKRKEDYEIGAQYEIIEETVAKKQREQEALLRSQRQQDANWKQQKHNEQIEKEFEVLESCSHTENSNVLLLPTQDSSNCDERMKEVSQSLLIQELKEERDQAIHNARLYRDLAEKN